MEDLQDFKEWMKDAESLLDAYKRTNIVKKDFLFKLLGEYERRFKNVEYALEMFQPGDTDYNTVTPHELSRRATELYRELKQMVKYK